MNVNIVEYLEVGHLNYTTRKELISKTGLSDRKNRQLIEEAILAGEPIVSSSQRPGYYISENPIQVIAAANDIEAKAYSLLARSKALRATAAKMRTENGEQVTLMKFE